MEEITNKYDTLIEEARKEYKETKSSLIAKYKPIIAEAKKAFDEESKKAKQKLTNIRSN